MKLIENLEGEMCIGLTPSDVREVLEVLHYLKDGCALERPRRISSTESQRITTGAGQSPGKDAAVQQSRRNKKRKFRLRKFLRHKLYVVRKKFKRLKRRITRAIRAGGSRRGSCRGGGPRRGAASSRDGVALSHRGPILRKNPHNLF